MKTKYISKKHAVITALLILSAVILVAYIVIFNSKPKKYSVKYDEETILSILSRVHIEFSTDGAGGSTLTFNDEARNLVFSYDDDILGVLIDNLSNPGPTSSVVDDNENVPLGYVCFDLLCTLVEATNDWFEFEYGDDGLWVNVKEDYYIPIENNKWNKDVAIAAQRHWKRLYEAGKLKINRQYFVEKYN